MKNHMKEKIMKRVKELEVIKKRTCYIAADRGGFSRTLATAILRGEANPTVTMIEKICVGFSITPREFFNSKLFDEVVE